MADRVSRQGKRKTVQFRGMFVWIIVFYFTTSFYPYAFYKKRLQTLFKDQLDRSKATCSFNRRVPIPRQLHPAPMWKVINLQILINNVIPLGGYFLCLMELHQFNQRAIQTKQLYIVQQCNYRFPFIWYCCLKDYKSYGPIYLTNLIAL